MRMRTWMAAWCDGVGGTLRAAQHQQCVRCNLCVVLNCQQELSAVDSSCSLVEPNRRRHRTTPHQAAIDECRQQLIDNRRPA